MLLLEYRHSQSEREYMLYRRRSGFETSSFTQLLQVHLCPFLWLAEQVVKQTELYLAEFRLFEHCVHQLRILFPSIWLTHLNKSAADTLVCLVDCIIPLLCRLNETLVQTKTKAQHVLELRLTCRPDL
jgi:hypothetical protein